jgi:hypothetical protein
MWDEKADGYARGDGVACVVMKKLSDAIADGDHIECIIRGSWFRSICLSSFFNVSKLLGSAQHLSLFAKK